MYLSTKGFWAHYPFIKILIYMTLTIYYYFNSMRRRVSKRPSIWVVAFLLW
jgi:hypothetical protein